MSAFYKNLVKRETLADIYSACQGRSLRRRLSKFIKVIKYSVKL